MAFALADCNNFYVSCERVFNPAFRSKPLVVLSNNDGCVISRSEEAKHLGISMGTPFFQIKPLVSPHGLHVLSSNYALYGSMSRRVMDVIQTFPVQREVYSIDEAFIKLPDDTPDALTDLCIAMRQRILLWTGIPVSIGIGKTKTLAKVANRLVKQTPGISGVMNLLDPAHENQALASFPVKDVWGVGGKIRKKLEQAQILTAAQLRDLDTFWMRSEYGVKGVALILELRGEVCNQLNTPQGQRKEIIVSRTFPRRLSGTDEIAPAFLTFAHNATQRLNAANLKAGAIEVYLSMDRYRADYQGTWSVQLDLETSTAHQGDIAYYVRKALEKIVSPATEYKKGGIILKDLSPINITQETLFLSPEPAPRSLKISRIRSLLHNKPPMDAIPKSAPSWNQKQDFISPRYTTRWHHLPKVK